MIQEMIAKVVTGNDLTFSEAEAVMREIMTGRASDAQIAGYITALRMKGETVAEIAGSAKVMREHATPILPKRRPLIDTCGTGGDGAQTFNISTTTAFVVAGCGLAVAKHGNRSVSSQCGSADLLEQLGVELDLTPEHVARCIDEAGIGFLYAPALHQAMKYAIEPRKQLGIRTIFNLLGPLTNPAGAEMQILGVFDSNLTRPLGEVLFELGTKHALVIHGHGQLDEISLSGPTWVTKVTPSGCVDEVWSPEDFGLPTTSITDIRGGSPEENARISESILRGEPGPRRDIVLANAAAALLVGNQVETLRDGVALAAECIDSGRAYETLSDLRRLSRHLAAGADDQPAVH